MDAIEFESRGSVGIFHLGGAISAYDAQDLRVALFRGINDNRVNRVVFDFSNVRSIDSSGVAVFLNLQFSFGADTRIRFCSVPKPVRDVLDATNLIQHFSVDPDLSGSIAALSG